MPESLKHLYEHGGLLLATVQTTFNGSQIVTGLVLAVLGAWGGSLLTAERMKAEFAAHQEQYRLLQAEFRTHTQLHQVSSERQSERMTRLEVLVERIDSSVKQQTLSGMQGMSGMNGSGRR
jgi:hypothetical protein